MTNPDQEFNKSKIADEAQEETIATIFNISKKDNNEFSPVIASQPFIDLKDADYEVRSSKLGQIKTVKIQIQHHEQHQQQQQQQQQQQIQNCALQELVEERKRRLEKLKGAPETTRIDKTFYKITFNHQNKAYTIQKYTLQNKKKRRWVLLKLK